jgi:hypothetical protein
MQRTRCKGHAPHAADHRTPQREFPRRYGFLDHRRRARTRGDADAHEPKGAPWPELEHSVSRSGICREHASPADPNRFAANRLALSTSSAYRDAAGGAMRVLSAWPRVRGRTGTKRRRSKVSPSEGNEARREGCQEVAASHSSCEAGERPIRTPWSEGDAALWTGSWNHAEDTVPHRRVTAKRPSRVRDSDTPQRDEPDALMCTSGSVGAVGGNPHGDPAPRKADPRDGAVPKITRAAALPPVTLSRYC